MLLGQLLVDGARRATQTMTTERPDAEDPDTEDAQSDELKRSDALSAVGAEPDLDASRDADRRGFIRGVMVSALAAAGFTGTAAAIDPTHEMELRAVERRYQDEDVARATFESQAADVLALLAERGYIEEPTASALSSDELAVSSWQVEGTTTARLEAFRDLDGGRLVVSVEPENGRAYAVDTTGAEDTIFDPDVDGDEVDTSACMEGRECMRQDECGQCQSMDVHCCTDGTCYLGTRYECHCYGCSTSSCADVCS